MRVHLAFVVIVIASVCVHAPARAQDLVRQTAPFKWLDPVLPEDLPELNYPAYANDLDRAKLEAFTGRYKRSLFTLLKVKDADPVEVALVKGTSLSAIGRREEAVEALSSPQVKDDPRVQVMRATVLAELGQTAEAIELLGAHLEAHPQSLAGRYQLGVAYELAGDLDKARGAYGWFVAEPQNFLEKWQRDRERAFDNAADVTTIGRAIDRWATLSGSYQKLPELHDALLNVFVRAYDVIDRAHWPARVASAEFYLSHDNDYQAKLELAAALKANPNDVRSLALVGRIALAEFDFDRADAATDAIRKVDADAVEANLLEARNMLQQRRPHDAAKPIEQVLSKQPDHLEALGLQAAVYALSSATTRPPTCSSASRSSTRTTPARTSRWPSSSPRCGSTRARRRCTRSPSSARPGGPRRATAWACSTRRAATRTRRRRSWTRPSCSTRSTCGRSTTSACSTTSRSSRARRPSTSS